MTCANWIITVLAFITGVLALWPIFGIASKWIILIFAIGLIAVSWTGVDCLYCKNIKKK